MNEVIRVDVNGTIQRVSLFSERAGAPPVLIVQAGPGLPLINEISRYQAGLALENEFTVAYWDQRGCGNAPPSAAESVTLQTQLDDLRFMIRWLAQRTGQTVTLFGISIGATLAMRAAAREAAHVGAVVAVSLDTDIPASDQHVFTELGSPRRLGPPPCVEPSKFQLRARLLTEAGSIEHGVRSFGRATGGLLAGLVRAYGPFGALASLRNMSSIQARLLPEMATLDLFADWPDVKAPVHYLFGEGDLLNPQRLRDKVSLKLRPGDSLVVLPDAGHMVHFDRPTEVRNILLRSRGTGASAATSPSSLPRPSSPAGEAR